MRGRLSIKQIGDRAEWHEIPVPNKARWPATLAPLRKPWKAVRGAATGLLGQDVIDPALHRLKVETRARAERAQSALRRLVHIPAFDGFDEVVARLSPPLLSRSRIREIEKVEHLPLPTEPTARVTSSGKLRVAMVMPWVQTGGVDRAAIDMAAGLPKDEFELSLLTTYPSRHEWEWRIAPQVADLIHLGHFSHVNEQVPYVARFVRDRGIDVLWTVNSWVGLESMMAVKRTLPGVRTADFQHTDFQAPGGDFARQSCKRYDRFIDLRMVSTEYLRKRYAHYGVAPGKVRVIRAGCDDERDFNPDRVRRGYLQEKLGLPLGTLVVGSIARLVEDKNPVFVARVYAHLARQWQDLSRPLHFVFIGEGPLQGAIVSEALREGIDGRHLHFLPANTDVASALRDFSLVLMASRIEGLPLVYFEAMSLGVPVVSTDIEGIPELVNAEVGACVANAPDDTERLDLLREAALPILENHALRADMGERARKRIVEGGFSAAQTRRDYLRAFGDLRGVK